MALCNEEYLERAMRLADRLHRFISSKTAPEGEDFTDIYDMIDNEEIKRHLEELEFQIFKRDAKRTEKAVMQIMDLL